MLFNSLHFAIFLPIVFLLYWFVLNKKLNFQNVFLLVSSYFFYACWDWRFLFLLAFSTLLDYFTGLKIYKSESDRAKKLWLYTSVIINLGFLGFFKYFNFFAESFAYMSSGVGLPVNYTSLNIILPIGISFYTFHGLSYVFDIFNKRIKPSSNFIEYSLFVSFFPLLVAGPIERATHLLPQVEKPRKFNYIQAVNGLKQIIWGLFKKIVIADTCAEYANMIFNNASDYHGSTLVLGAVFFAFQIYGDFSGYSDIALGVARLFGFELLRNFAFPYFSRDIAEFCRRWHISLSSWFKDYLYFPLGGSRGGMAKTVRNTFIIFIVSGFWHGANWTFIVWGGLNALFIMPLVIFSKNRANLEIVAKGSIFPSLKDFFSILLTFSLSTFAWIFFRAKNLGAAIDYISNIFSPALFQRVEIVLPWYVGVIVLLFIAIEWLGREGNYAIENINSRFPVVFRWFFYYAMLVLIFTFAGKEQEFIYFQF